MAWRRQVLPWFSVRDLSACLRGAAVTLGSSVLRCSWSSRWVTCLGSGLCSSSVRDHDEDFPSFWWVWFLAFVRGPLPQAGAVFLVLEAVPSSHRLVLLLRTGLLFSGPGWCGRLPPFPSPLYSFRMWSPFGSVVSFCHS